MQQSSANRYWLYSYELLFSLNLALVLTWESAQTSASRTALSLQGGINHLMRYPPQSPIGGYIAFTLLSVAQGFVIFLMLRLLSYATIVNRILLPITGIASLIVLPLSWLSFHRQFPGFFVGPGALPDLPHWWLYIELVLCVILAALFLRGWMPFLKGWAGVFLLLFHFIVWGWLFLGGTYFWLTPAKAFIVFTGFCSCLEWGQYVGPRVSHTTQGLLNSRGT